MPNLDSDGEAITEPASARNIAVTLGGRRFEVSHFTFLLVMGALVGAATAAVVVVFRLAALHGEDFLFPSNGSSMDLWSTAALRRVLMPALGGLITGGLLYGLWKFEEGHSIPAILRAVASGQIFFKPRMAIPPAMAIITLATGGSVGPEGPVAELGAVMGSTLGRWARVPPRFLKTLIGAGVAAGIAAVFNAPIAGIFFALEVILRNYEVASFTPIAVASVVASVIAQGALRHEAALTFPVQLEVPISQLPLFAVLGLVCGFVSLAYIHALAFCHDRFHQVRLPLWVRPAIGGLMVGLLGWVMPNVLGEGYGWMNQVLNIDFTPISGSLLSGFPLHAAAQGAPPQWFAVVVLLAALAGVKILATAISLGSGSPGGSFAPAVFIGAMAGAAFGVLARGLHLSGQTAGYTMMGIAGLIGGALGAPITAIMIVLRQGSLGPQILLPLLTTVALSMFVMQRRRGISVYTLGLMRLGIDLDHARRADPLSLVRIESVMQTQGHEEIAATLPLVAAIARVKNSLARWFVVRGEDGAFVGLVSLHEMRMAIAEQELAQLLVVADIVDNFAPRLACMQSLKDALAYFMSHDAEVLPVFASAQRDAAFVGLISRGDALGAYARYAEARE